MISMKTTAGLSVLASLFVATVAHADAAPFKFDAAHSSVEFTATHLGVSEVPGKFTKFDAKVTADAKTAKLKTLVATAKVSSVDTGNKKRDKHLTAKDFFYASKYPELKIVLKSIRFAGKKFTAKVDLTMRGKTRPVVFKGTYSGAKKVNLGQGDQIRAAYKAKATVDRQKFGLTFNQTVGGDLVVSDDIEIELNAAIYRPL